MENSFFEYRDKTGVNISSESEVIDDSLVADEPLSVKKKNHTVFVPESEESSTDVTDETEEEENTETDEAENTRQNVSKSVVRRSNVADAHVISSDDDASRRGSIIRKSEMSYNEIVLSSSDDEAAVSPEMVPRRPPTRHKSTESNNPIVRAINKKRMIFDSDLDNSIIIEHNKNKKIACLKDTPLKIDNGKVDQKADESIQSASGEDTDDDEVLSHLKNKSNKKDTLESGQSTSDENDVPVLKSSGKKINNRKIIASDESTDYDDSDESESDSDNDDIALKCAAKKNRKLILSDESEDSDNNGDNDHNDYNDDSDHQGDDNDDESDDGPDEDQMVMSRATRMSIMGVIPKDNGSDESDLIQSDESHRKSTNSVSTESLTELPDAGVSLHKTPPKHLEPEGDSSRITCSPFCSPLHDITNEIGDSTESSKRDGPIKIDLTQNAKNVLKNKVLNNLVADKMMVNKENHDVMKVDDDVTIIDTKPEIIALSSDDEEEVKVDKKSPNNKISPKPKNERASSKVSKENTIKSYLVPPSYPNQGVVYVKKHVRENELSKLNGMKEDLHNIRHLLENMDVDTLPDGGVKLIERLTGLEAEIRRQGDKVANMIVEPENPTVEQMANDGFAGKVEKGLSWDDIQKVSNAVQPRMFGKQAMATHMAERNIILDRLRDLHESLASRPPESELAVAPKSVATKLMPHQLHALAWLRWRETQRPAAGILADDMGLGKTITMIALIAGDQQNRIDDDDDSDDEDARSSAKLTRGGTLVVCPASLMQQWAGEVGKHCAPHALAVCQHHGPARAQHAHRLATHDLVLTTYNILQRDNEKKGVLMRVRWHRVILDEAHIVRNHKSATSAAVSALHARRRWCLTGTPVQNKDLDLFALLKFLRCSPFDELTMWKKWIDNKSLGGQERLSTIMRCVLLRRTKQQLQQRGQLDCLPERSAHHTLVTLTKPEMNVYQKVLVFSKTLFAQFLHQRAEKNADSQDLVRPDKDTQYAKMHKKMIALQGAKPVKSHEILVLLLRLRQVCCHCGLIAAMLDEEGAGDVDEDPAGGDLLAELNKLTLEDAGSNSKNDKTDDTEEKEEEPHQEGTTAAEAIRSVLSPNNPVFELDRPSSKIKAVMDCLNENVFPNKGEKAVVVSQWTSVLRLVQQALARLRPGVRSVTLSGHVPVPARAQLVHALNDPNSDVRVMLLSLCAGGVGLNLCGANHLLLLDPHWNPQLEEQAQDRIYRVGQKKHVHIYRFLCVDTVEQTIKKLQEVKLELAENVLTGAKNTNSSKLTIEDLKMLFNMGQQ